MIRRSPLLIFAALLAACGPSPTQTAGTDLPAADLRSGYTFLTAETQAMQDDSFANPGYLWVDRGAALFENRAGDAPSCASCHGEGLTGIAATYPAIDETSGDLLNLEGRINQCRIRHKNLPALDYESDELLALTAFIANQSAGMPVSVSIDGAAAPHYRNGRDYFFTRRGQFNLSCHQCHDENAGKRLRGDTISQGHGNGFPAYRLEWQTSRLTPATYSRLRCRRPRGAQGIRRPDLYRSRTVPELQSQWPGYGKPSYPPLTTYRLNRETHATPKIRREFKRPSTANDVHVVMLT